MSRLPEYCECSKPNSKKSCRIPCGLRRWDGDNWDYVLPDNITLPQGNFVFDTVQADDELEPVLDTEGNPMYLLGYPVMQKKEKKEDDSDG